MRLLPSKLIRPLLPVKLLSRAEPYLGMADSIFSSDDDRARAQRLALITYMVRIFSAGLAFVTQIIMARLMSGHEYGIFVVVWTWVIVLGGVASLGLVTACVRLVPEYLAHEKFELLRGLLLQSRLFAVATATLIAVAGIAGIYFFGDAIASYYVWPFYLAMICLPLFTLTDIQDGIALSQDWHTLALQPTYIWRPVMILAGMGILILTSWQTSAVNVCIIAIIATWLTAIIQLLLVNRRLHEVIQRGPRQFATKSWIALSLPLFMVEGFFILLASVDVLILNLFETPERVAVYFAATKTLALVHFVYFAVRAAAGHRFSRLYHTGQHTELAKLMQDTVRWTFWPSVACGVTLLLTGYYLLMLFGSDYTAGYPMLAILLVGILIRASIGPVSSLLTMAGYQKQIALVYGTSLAANILLNFALIPHYGLSGAAIATTLAVLVETLALWGMAKQKMGLNTFIWQPAQESIPQESTGR
ncbi:MAG: polysaccharide biosynthesis C-terminal domain-containing protein [Stappiaceae bacterium]